MKIRTIDDLESDFVNRNTEFCYGMLVAANYLNSDQTPPERKYLLGDGLLAHFNLLKKGKKVRLNPKFRQRAKY